jgi:hypothetical protein
MKKMTAKKFGSGKAVGKPGSKPAAAITATGKAKSYTNKSTGTAGGGMGIGKLGKGNFRGS